MLDKRGHHVVVAENGKRSAARTGETQAFDLVLMDVQMPEMDGFEATGVIRGKERASGTASADHRHDRPRDEGRS